MHKKDLVYAANACDNGCVDCIRSASLMRGLERCLTRIKPRACSVAKGPRFKSERRRYHNHHRTSLEGFSRPVIGSYMRPLGEIEDGPGNECIRFLLTSAAKHLRRACKKPTKLMQHGFLA